jgi:hypothetical protein
MKTKACIQMLLIIQILLMMFYKTKTNQLPKYKKKILLNIFYSSNKTCMEGKKIILNN